MLLWLVSARNRNNTVINETSWHYQQLEVYTAARFQREMMRFHLEHTCSIPGGSDLDLWLDHSS